MVITQTVEIRNTIFAKNINKNLEYNEIEITAVRVYLTKTNDRGLVEKLIAEDLPDTQVIVQEE